MKGASSGIVKVAAVVAVFSWASPLACAQVDIDGSGYVDLCDFACFCLCFEDSGPGAAPASQNCLDSFDSDEDDDVDLVDYVAYVAGYEASYGHLPMPLRDSRGEVITLGSVEPYSARQTCGGCHDLNRVTNGFLFQQGRTATDGTFDMADDYYADGRWWIKSSGRYGKWGQTFKYLLAAKDNTHPSQIEQTAFAWIRDCSSCHPGGGPGEFDRDGELFYDEVTQQFGYELLDKTADDVALDGDYSVLDYATGSARLAPWDVTGLSSPDCLRCHRTQRTVTDGGVDMNFVWRKSVLEAADTLVDDQNQPVAAFAAASTAGQGWFSILEIPERTPERRLPGPSNVADAAFLEDRPAGGKPRTAATRLRIDYQKGVDDGSLLLDFETGELALAPTSVTWPPKDRACWACHPYGTITGTVWFDDSNIHYRKFNNLNDDDPGNDVPPDESRVCTVCHAGDLDHNFGRGNSMQIHYRDDLDWNDTFRMCRRCHLTELPNGQPNPWKHPESPDVPGPGDVRVHFAEPFEAMSCQACHIPYSLTEAVLFRDITIPGAVGTTSWYLSADPLDPSNTDKSRWYPALQWKTDVDGVERLFPVNIWIMIYWADWDQNGTPDYYDDDIISPIYTWRINQLIPEPLDVVTDDNGDGQLEINRPAEILAYIEVLKGNDSTGQPVARNPVLVKGKRVWYEDQGARSGVGYFDHTETNIPMTWYPYLWGKDHNVRPKEESWGYSWFNPQLGCNHCHAPAPGVYSPVFDRKILVDPYGPDGLPVYETVREMTGANPDDPDDL